MQCNYITSSSSSFYPITHSQQPLPFDSFHVTSFLNQAQRDQIEQSRSSYSDIKELLPILNALQGMKEIALDFENYQLYPMMALHAYFQKEISEEQFATLCMLYNAIDQMIVSPVRLETFYDAEAKKSTSYRLDLTATLYKNAPQDVLSSKIRTHYIHTLTLSEKKLIKSFFHFSDAGLERMLNLMKREPHSEQFFYSILLPYGPLVNWSPLYHRITDVTTFFNPVNTSNPNYKGPFPPLQPQRILIPSFTMFKIFFKIAFADSFVRLQPILGEVTDAMIDEHKQQGIRLINIGIPGIDVPEIADGFFSGKWVFILHDLYHALRDSTIPKPMQQALCRISRITTKFMEEHSGEKALIDQCQVVKRRINDGELFSFDPIRSGDFSGKYATIKALFQRIAWPHKLKQTIISDIAGHPSEWKKYHITLEQLENKNP